MEGNSSAFEYNNEESYKCVDNGSILFLCLSKYILTTYSVHCPVEWFFIFNSTFERVLEKATLMTKIFFFLNIYLNSHDLQSLFLSLYLLFIQSRMILSELWKG
jgi:hypothetical protein